MMINHEKENVAGSDLEKVSPKTLTWRRVLKVTLVLALIITLCGGGFVGVLFFRYHRIVSAKPGMLLTQVRPAEIGRWVNPFIGTGGFPWVCGHNFPGAMVPFGMVRLGPETASILIHKRALNTSGYYYGDDQILGFSHTRLNGTGAAEGGHFLVMPTRDFAEPHLLRQWQSATFSHSEELASPGYYAVRLPKPGVLVELTATPRVGVHRYTFSDGKAAHLMLDVMNSLGGRRASEGNVRILPEAGEVEGSVKTFGTFSGRYGGIKVYFVAKLSQSLASFTCLQDDIVASERAFSASNRARVYLGLVPTNGPLAVTLKLAISYVSIENARTNLQVEAGGKEFEQVVAEAQRAWEERLGSIRIEGGNEEQKEVFYTALFRTFQMPTVFNDANGDYFGFDRQVHKVSDFHYFTDMSLWDTFRTTHPLYTLIAPQDQRDMLISLVKMLEQGGWLPRWPSGHGYSNSMLGTPADIVIADSYLKGIRDFDVAKAYQAMRRTALGPTPPGAVFSGREGVREYLQYGYCPAGLVRNSVTRTLEYSWADQAIAQLAESLGNAEDATMFRKHAQSYRNVWNPETQYFQPRNAKGRFVEPFKPLLADLLRPQGQIHEGLRRGQRVAMALGRALRCRGVGRPIQKPRVFRRGNSTASSPNPTRPGRTGILGLTIGTATSRISTRPTCSTMPVGQISPRSGCAGSWTISTASATTAWTATTMAERFPPGTSSVRSVSIPWRARTDTNWERPYSKGLK